MKQNDIVSPSGTRKVVFISYRYGHNPRFDQVRQFAARLRFFSLEVILDQRSLAFGEDIRGFMSDAVRRADAMIVMLTHDYNEALGRTEGAGAGIRYEVTLALGEKAHRPAFQIIPVLLDEIRPCAPLDRLKCAKLDDIDQIVTQLALTDSSACNRVLGQRYRIDLLVEQRGITRVFRGWDTVMDHPIEIYFVPSIHASLKERFGQFERVVRGRSMAFSPFLLNIKDTHIDSDGSFFIITERFDGTDLEVLLKRCGNAHPVGALLVAYQLCLGLHELHSAGVIHGGLAARTIRLNPSQTRAKIVDYEFATTTDNFVSWSTVMEGYPLIAPPERFHGKHVSVAQDIFQIGNLLFRLLTGRAVASTELRGLQQHPDPASLFWLEEAELEGRLGQCLKTVLRRFQWKVNHPWLAEMTSRVTSELVIEHYLVPLLARCLHPDPVERPKTCLEIVKSLAEVGVPASGCLAQVLPDSGGLIFGGIDAK